jgi:excisionase family DNA binding protein
MEVKMQKEKGNTFINAKSAGEILDLKPETIRMYARKGKIPFIRIGRSVRFRVSDVMALTINNNISNPVGNADAIKLEGATE